MPHFTNWVHKFATARTANVDELERESDDKRHAHEPDALVNPNAGRLARYGGKEKFTHDQCNKVAEPLHFVILKKAVSV